MSSPIPETASASESARGLRAYAELTKPGIALYVTLLAGVAFLLAGGADAGWDRLVHMVGGMALATAGALALNQYLERDVDRLMVRTRTRPLPSARVAPTGALVFGLGLFVTGVGWLWIALTPAAAVLTLLSGAAYNLVYTPLKRRSYLATLAGAVPGALPALIGWSAASGWALPTAAWVLFVVAYLWQMPHVLGLAWVLRADYARAGFHMTPPADAEGRIIGVHMILYAAALIPMSLLPTVIGLTGGLYFWGALLLGLWLLWLSVGAGREMSTRTARSVFLGSLLYQPLLLALLLVDGVVLR